MKQTTIIILSLLALLLSQAVTASDQKGQFAIRGAGLISCAMYAKEHKAHGDVYKIVSSWIDGYLTGINQFAPGTYDWLSFETTELLLEIINNHCQKNPGDPVFGVLQSLLQKLKEGRLQEKSEKDSITIDTFETSHYVEVIRRLQIKLKNDGFYQGEINGKFTQQTSDAVKSFQKSLDFKPTGFPDQTTLWRLMRSGDQNEGSTLR